MMTSLLLHKGLRLNWKSILLIKNISVLLINCAAHQNWPHTQHCISSHPLASRFFKSSLQIKVLQKELQNCATAKIVMSGVTLMILGYFGTGVIWSFSK